MQGLAIDAQQLSKRFGQVLANDHVSLQVRTGHIHGLIGENGAGKSTLMNMLYGLYQPDQGQLRIFDTPVAFSSPQDAIGEGLGMVHQHFMLVDIFTALENIILGVEKGALLAKTRDDARAELVQLGRDYGLLVDLDTPIHAMSVGERQKVEILKALYRKARILILDEPTGVLTPLETVTLFTILRRLKAEGRTILLISHKLDEIIEITDRVSVMRGGKIISEHATKNVSANQLAEDMIGRPIVRQVERLPQSHSQAILDISDLSVCDDKGHKRLNNVSFQVKNGEILGIAGVAGNGQSELMAAITGMCGVDGGQIHINGACTADKTTRTPAHKLRAMGMGHVAEDRHHHAMVGAMTARDNSILGYQSSETYARSGWLKKKTISQFSKTLLKNFDVRPNDDSLPLSGFSGGNQQKLVIGRELSHQPNLLVVGQPTRGVDIGSITFIHDRLMDMRNKGGAVLLISSELDELLTLSDRVLVMNMGRIMGEFIPGTISETEIGLLMAGQVAKVAS